MTSLCVEIPEVVDDQLVEVAVDAGEVSVAEVNQGLSEYWQQALKCLERPRLKEPKELNKLQVLKLLKLLKELKLLKVLKSSECSKSLECFKS